MHRRHLIGSALAGTAALAAPHIVRAEAASVLKFIPFADLATLDPVFTTAAGTRCHAHLVFDTLYGMDNDFRANPQMVAGHVISEDGRQWDLTLREGLRFHDGTQVLARDAVASIRRWWKRDGFGAQLAARTDELSAPSDSVIRFRLNKRAGGDHQRAGDHARAARADRSIHSGHRNDRQRSVPLQGG
jgi:peptide/nickel transport system substrate-binding protein